MATTHEKKTEADLIRKVRLIDETLATMTANSKAEQLSSLLLLKAVESIGCKLDMILLHISEMTELDVRKDDI